MLKQRLPRFIALLGTSAVVASLIGVAVVGTGAYFTDSNSGEITGNLATVAVTTSGGTGTDNLDFVWGNMLPGVDSVASVHVQNTGSVPEDIYLAFKNDNGAWSAINTYGAYGIFTVNNVIYDNLNNQYAWGTPSEGTICGGLAPRPAQIKYLPHVIFLGTLGPTASKDFDIKFQWHACMTAGQGAEVFGAGASGPAAAIVPAPLEFQIAAFQVGINPNNPFNGPGGVINDLTLPYGAGQLSGMFQ